MKKIIKIVVITSILMIAAIGAFLWKMNGIGEEQRKKEEKILAQERDLVADNGEKAIDKVKDVEIQDLYLVGDKKNVLTMQYGSVAEIYDTKKSAESEEMLTDIKKNKSFSFDNPMWAYNPYGSNPLGMYVYFRSSGNGYCRYTISVDDKDIPDFTRTLRNNKPDNVTKEHEYQIIGLVPGMTNYITLNFYNREDELGATATYRVQVPGDKVGAATKLATEKGYSKTTISNGLYTVFSGPIKGRDGKNRYGILQYDNSGVLRSEFPIQCGNAWNMSVIYDNLLITWGPNKMARINSLGQVIQSYSLDGYQIDGEYSYDGSGNIYVIATENKKNASKNSKILKVSLETGEYDVALDMEKILPQYYKKACKKSQKAGRDWVLVDSVVAVGNNRLLVSSKSLSTVFNVSQVNSLLPRIEQIIADPDLWKNDKTLSKKILVKTLPEGTEVEPSPTPVVDSILEKPKEVPVFPHNYGQNAMELVKGESTGDGSYTFTMLNNNHGKGAKSAKNSSLVTYYVDEGASAVQEKESIPLPMIPDKGSAFATKEVILYCQSDKNCFKETDMQGKLIKGFSSLWQLYRVYKQDWKKFWFY